MPFDYYSLGSNAPFFFLGILLAAILLFLLLRELVTWYWKINETIEVLKDINLSLRHIAAAIAQLHGTEGATTADRAKVAVQSPVTPEYRPTMQPPAKD